MAAVVSLQDRDARSQAGHLVVVPMTMRPILRFASVTERGWTAVMFQIIARLDEVFRGS